MSEASERPDGATRFPLLELGFCLACVGVAVLLWLEYSCAWDVEPSDLRINDFDDDWFHVLRYERDAVVEGRYLCLGGYVQRTATKATSGVGSETFRCAFIGFTASGDDCQAWAYVGEDLGPWQGGETGTVKGRLLIGCEGTVTAHPLVDATASRFTGESVAGLFVGAMGVLVFALAFRHWLTHRKTPGPRATC